MPSVILNRCPVCQSPAVKFFPKSREIYCEYCNKTFSFTRKQINTESSVVTSSRNAVRFFKEGNYAKASDFAVEVLKFSFDNAPALFVLAYCDEIIMKKPEQFELFFDTLKDVEMGSEELSDLMELFKTASQSISGYEKNIIELIINGASEDMSGECAEFFEQMCPYWIMHRNTYEFLDDDMVRLYKMIASNLDTPKISYALYNAIVKLPDSPFKDDTFFLVTRTKKFYNGFVLPVGEIIDCMVNPVQKKKFQIAYESRKKQYEEKMRNA